MLSADYVIGSRGDFKTAANEVAIGLTMPRVAAAMLHHTIGPYRTGGYTLANSIPYPTSILDK